jgi:hypothetical protein
MELTYCGWFTCCSPTLAAGGNGKNHYFTSGQESKALDNAAASKDSALTSEGGVSGKGMGATEEVRQLGEVDDQTHLGEDEGDGIVDDGDQAENSGAVVGDHSGDFLAVAGSNDGAHKGGSNGDLSAAMDSDNDADKEESNDDLSAAAGSDDDARKGENGALDDSLEDNDDETGGAGSEGDKAGVMLDNVGTTHAAAGGAQGGAAMGAGNALSNEDEDADMEGGVTDPGNEEENDAISGAGVVGSQDSELRDSAKEGDEDQGAATLGAAILGEDKGDEVEEVEEDDEGDAAAEQPAPAVIAAMATGEQATSPSLVTVDAAGGKAQAEDGESPAQKKPPKKKPAYAAGADASPEGKGIDKFHIVLTVDDTPYNQWQTRVVSGSCWACRATPGPPCCAAHRLWWRLPFSPLGAWVCPHEGWGVKQ